MPMTAQETKPMRRVFFEHVQVSFMSSIMEVDSLGWPLLPETKLLTRSSGLDSNMRGSGWEEAAWRGPPERERRKMEGGGW